jgi:hypothetical protein
MCAGIILAEMIPNPYLRYTRQMQLVVYYVQSLTSYNLDGLVEIDQ